jgi:hypothetical protein
MTVLRCGVPGMDESSATDPDAWLWLDRWHAIAAQELSQHTALDGLCRSCGAAWPCPICVRAEFALGSL